MKNHFIIKLTFDQQYLFMKGFSLTEMLIVLFLLSILTMISFIGFSNSNETHAIKSFQTQLSTAIKLAQSTSLTRNEDLIICAQKQGICQMNWQGNLVLLAQNETILQDFGATQNLTIKYDGITYQDRLFVKSHGLLINNGHFTITTPQHSYIIKISKQGILHYESTTVRI